MRELACRALERSLAQGQASEAALAACQRAFATDEPAQIFLNGARATRAEMHAMLDSESSWPGNRLRRSLIGAASLGSRATVLRVLTGVVEIAKLPPEEQMPAFDQNGLPPESQWPILARTYLRPRIQRIATDLMQQQKSSQVELRCAIAALAAERYRLAHGAWPPSLAALVPHYLSAVPLDLYAGKPLRLRRLGDGLVIYSVGLDGSDNGGQIDRLTPDATGRDRE
jgi:hypothetical protein